MSNLLKSSILGLLLVLCLPAHAACEGLDFPLSSSNSNSVENIGETIVIKDNNQVILGGKAKRNAFFEQTVEAAVFPDRLVKTRKFKIQGNKNIKINFTVETLTSQYHFTDETLASRTFAIAELDDSGAVSCVGFIESVSASAGTTTIKKGTVIVPGVNFTGSLANPIQVYIREKGPNVTIQFKDIILEPGKTYQFEFISQGEKAHSMAQL